MSGQLKEVRLRIQSVQNMQQITKAMKMVSAAKLRKAQDAIIQMRPYARKLQDVLSNIVSGAKSNAVGKLAEERQIEKVLLIVITSDRGLCGAYNANLIKTAKAVIKDQYAAQNEKGNVTIWSIGKKGYEHFAKNNFKVSEEYKDLIIKLSFENIQACAQAAVKAFENEEFDVVEIVYSQFINAASQ